MNDPSESSKVRVLRKSIELNKNHETPKFTVQNQTIKLVDNKI